MSRPNVNQHGILIRFETEEVHTRLDSAGVHVGTTGDLWYFGMSITYASPTGQRCGTGSGGGGFFPGITDPPFKTRALALRAGWQHVRKRFHRKDILAKIDKEIARPCEPVQLELF